MRNTSGLLVLLAGLVCATSVSAAPRPDPIVLSLDGRHHIVWNVPVDFDPAERLILAPDAIMTNCRRSGGGAFVPADLSFVYSPLGAWVPVSTVQIQFNPTRFVMSSATGDVICDNEALGWQTGLDRLFRSDFEPD